MLRMELVRDDKHLKELCSTERKIGCCKCHTIFNATEDIENMGRTGKCKKCSSILSSVLLEVKW